MSTWRAMSGVVACLFTVFAAGVSLAQQPPAQPAAQGEDESWAAGRPRSDAAVALAPVGAPPIPTPAARLPVTKMKVPDGFKVEVWAAGVANARSMAVGDKGTVFVGTRQLGNVYAITDSGGKRTVKTIAKGLHRPNGVAFKDGALYVTELSRILRYDDIEQHLDAPPEPKVIYDDLPKDEPHGWKFIAIGPDDKLYVPIGAPCNICEPPETHAQIRRIALDGSGAEVVARGVRNTVGFDFDPKTGDLWFTDNGRDWMSEDIPNDELNHLTQPGQEHFGYPFCHQGSIRDPEFGWGKSCEETTAPAALLGPHIAALGMEFYTGSMFPEAYRGAIFIARHGPWNRTEKIGADIAVATLDADGRVTRVEPFLTGLIENNGYLGRPVDVETLPDGSLLVSDDHNGAIYRVSYGG
ncbi:PQQ-dependent sugar dehydrogenase [Inquilinus limosus]|uniref:PQQ-dependent sugar dehydrogenase n=1 Tax=Inquilinus limosus TaxID=171674 RepID=UPI003F17033C